MELQLKFTSQIEEVQQKLRECNFECNRLKDLVANALPEILKVKESAEAELQQKIAQVAALQKQLFQLQNPNVESLSPVAEPETPEIVITTTPSDSPAPVLETVSSEIPTTAITAPESHQEEKQQVTSLSASISTPSVSAQQPSQQANSAKDKNAKPAKSNAALEDFIGGNLLNKIGIGILIIGIGIFVKYAIDQDWIGAVGRVMIGLLSGGILMGVAHWLRKSYKAFSSVLLGGGVAVNYFSIAIAYHQYQLLGQSAAFGIMCAITAATVFFSIAYNRQEIAILALLGSFATPFMVSNGSGNYVVLFSYLLVVNTGMMALSWFRDWKLVRWLAFGLTSLLFGGWIAVEAMKNGSSFPSGGLVFSVLFFLVFFVMTIGYRIRKQEQSDLGTYLGLLGNSAFFYIASMAMLYFMDAQDYMGIFTALTGLFHFLFILPLRKFLKVGDHLQTMLVALTMSFVTLAIPIQLEGKVIPMFWAAEALILLGIYSRAKWSVLKVGSILVSMLSVVMLGRTWMYAYLPNLGTESSIIFNGTFLTSVVVAAGLLLAHFFHQRQKEAADSKVLALFFQVAFLVTLYLGINFDVLNVMHPMDGGMRLILWAAITGGYLITTQIWMMAGKQMASFKALSGITAIFSLIWAAVQGSALNPARMAYRDGELWASFFPSHLFAFVLVIAALLFAFRMALKQTDTKSDIGKMILLGFCGIVVLNLSLELDNITAMMGIASRATHTVGYPILWGVSGFVMILVGLQKKHAVLRVAGLGLFALILLKLFAYDIWSVSAGGRIAAFISLGVLLLVISFMYQRLRRLISDDGEKPANPNV
jgi:uncharacterized membrane protein